MRSEDSVIKVGIAGDTSYARVGLLRPPAGTLSVAALSIVDAWSAGSHPATRSVRVLIVAVLSCIGHKMAIL